MENEEEQGVPDALQMTPVRQERIWKQILDRCDRISRLHHSNKGVHKWTIEETLEKKDSYFGPRKTISVAYDPRPHHDRYIDRTEGYSNKLHRSDRRLYIDIGNSVHKEEVLRTLPVLSSGQYGRRVRSTLHALDRELMQRSAIITTHYDKNFVELPKVP